MTDPNPEAAIRELVDRETEAWNQLDAETLVSLFHPDMVWPWPPDATAHDPALWVFPLGRFDRERWKRGWEKLFRDYGSSTTGVRPSGSSSRERGTAGSPSSTSARSGGTA